MKILWHSNRYLTDDEEKLIVNVAIILASMGLGIDKTTCLSIINTILQARIEKIHFKPATMNVLNQIMKKHKELVHLIHGNAVDPARVR